ncbi:MAG: DUF3108 domain-containing protein [Pseudomonadota bacterium]
MRTIAFAALAALASLGLPGTAAALDRMELDIELRVLGMQIGDVTLTSDLAEAAITSRMDVATRGMVERLTGFRSEIEAAGRFGAGGDVRPVRFASFYETKRETREVDVRYGDDGTVEGLATFKRGVPTDVDVPEHLRHGTLDPLSALFTIRSWLAEVRDAGPAERRLELFDGRRRYDLDVRLIERRAASFGGGTPVLELILDVIPLAGFNEKPGERNDRRLHVLVSDDDLLVPLVIRTAVADGLDALARTRRVCAVTSERTCRDVAY